VPLNRERAMMLMADDDVAAIVGTSQENVQYLTPRRVGSPRLRPSKRQTARSRVILAASQDAVIDEVAERFGDTMAHAFRSRRPMRLGVSGGDFDAGFDLRFRRVPPFRPETDAESLAEAVRELRRAERPAIVVGDGVVWSGAENEVVALAEKLAIPVATSLNAKAAIAEDHPLCVGGSLR
jgi:TPP-dependent 2-oxoacid decarboxylase